MCPYSAADLIHCHIHRLDHFRYRFVIIWPPHYNLCFLPVSGHWDLLNKKYLTHVALSCFHSMVYWNRTRSNLEERRDQPWPTPTKGTLVHRREYYLVPYDKRRYTACLCMLDMAHICCACEGCSESGIWVLDFERWPRLWEAYSVGIFGMFLGADLANCFSISKLGIASNKPTQGYGEKCDELW